MLDGPLKQSCSHKTFSCDSDRCLPAPGPAVGLGLAGVGQTRGVNLQPAPWMIKKEHERTVKLKPNEVRF